jgi:methylenetetrahydrofolate dehydrogenase (NADP+)/methenyltetrahydrofolate cyclohydrolase
MSATLIDGKAGAERVRREVKARVEALAARGVFPGLAVVLIGDDPASAIYVKKKLEACKRTGIRSELVRLPADVTFEAVAAKLSGLNADPTIHGILVQLPLPRGLDTRAVIDLVDPDKDVDGLHPLNVGRLQSGIPCLVPCTPSGVMRLLAEAGVELKGRSAVVLGRSAIVGRPMAALLQWANATVTICHSHTQDVRAIASGADVLVSGVGRPEMIDASWVKPGAVVIDVGINRLDDGRVVGDCADSVREVASMVTPVPGGVGPMTVAMLLANTVQAAEWRLERPR